MAYSPQQLQAALQAAQATGDTQAVATIQQAMQAAPAPAQAAPSMDPDALTQAFYKAKLAGDEDAAGHIFHALRQTGANLRPMTQDEAAASYQRQNGQAVDGGSATDNLAAGAGKSVVDNGRGINQLNDLAAQFLDPANAAIHQAAYASAKQEQSDANSRDAALMNTKAGLVGNVAGQIGQAVVGGSALKGAGLLGNGVGGYGTTALSGGAQGLLQPLADGQGEDQRVLNGAIGAGAGVLGRGVAQGIGNVVRRGVPAIAGLLTPKASAETAQLASSAINDYGIPLSAADVTPSKVVKALDSVSAKVPFSGASAFKETQQKAFNSAVANTIGEDADRITPAVYSQAKKRIGSVYDDITARNNVQVTPDLQQGLLGVLDHAKQYGNDDSVRAVTGLLSRIDNQAANGVIPGKAFQSIQSEIGSIAKSGGEKGNYAGQIRGLLSGALSDSISPADQQAWKTANQQYGNLKTIRDLVTKDQVSGNVSPAALLGRVTANGAKKEAVATGRGGDLAQLAAIGQQFLKDGVPNSGTPERLAAYGLLGGASFAHAPSALATVAGARGYQALMQSPQLLAKVLSDPSIDQATKSAIVQRLGASAGLLSQQASLGYQRGQSPQSITTPGLLQASP